MGLKRSIDKWLIYLGFNRRNIKKSISSLLWFYKDYLAVKNQNNSNFEKWDLSLFPIFLDKFDASGVASGHYFYQDTYVARKIYEHTRGEHLDIGSRVDGFVAQVSIFQKIDVMDIRPLETKAKNINFFQMDLMNPSFDITEKYDSLSCLHAIEHFGLGRYGDPIDINGHIKAIAEMKKFLKKGGIFYFSTQVGKNRIEFNAHRFFSIGYILNTLFNDYELLEYSYVDDSGDFHENVELTEVDILSNFGCNAACGIFLFRKNEI